jgi:hypothetical protein
MSHLLSATVRNGACLVLGSKNILLKVFLVQSQKSAKDFLTEVKMV